MRVKLLLSYNGANFEGSQVQSHTSNTIMGQIYIAFERLGIKTKLHASGRTDAGVHAFKQVMHCEVPPFWADIKKLQDHLNFQLPDSIKLRQLSVVDEEFHARYSAKRRAYRYILSTGESNPFESAFITFIKYELDFNLLYESIKLFEGEHDFSSFMKKGSTTGSNIRNIYKARVYTYKGRTVLYFEANGFLRSQIRLMVAFLLKVAKKELTKEQLLEQLTNQEKYNTKPAPPNGLYLSNIIY